MLEIEESTESGKNWPHGQREFRPPLSPAMRALLEDHHEETLARGRNEGRRELEDELTKNGIACMILGMIFGIGGCLAVQHVIAHFAP